MNQFLEKLYLASPATLKNIIVSAYGIIEYNRRYLGSHNDYLKMLRATASFRVSEFAKFQNEQLNIVISHALKEVPYYQTLFKSLSLGPEDITTIEDLHKIPILEKETVRKHGINICAKNMLTRNTLHIHTSGTSGKALTIYCDKESRRRHYAFWTRLREWNGIKRRDKRATLFGRVICDANRKKPPFWVYDAFGKNLLMSSYHLSKDNILFYIDKLEKFKPLEIIGYPSSIFLLAQKIIDEKISHIHPKIVFTTAETLTNYQRKAIEKAFKCRVIDQYGSAEMAFFVAECKHGRSHVHPEHGLIEVLDEKGNKVEPGYEGEAVCTGLVNMTMPLIRYRIGDIISLDESPCDCGFNSPILKEIQGRSDDVIQTPEGKYIGRLSPVWKIVDGIQQTQVIQRTIDSLEIYLVVDENKFNKNEDINRIERELRNRVGEKIKLQFFFKNYIKKDDNGKFRTIISCISK